MQAIAKEREHTFVDWFDVRDKWPLTEDGAKLTSEGYYRVAPIFSASLGALRHECNFRFDNRNQTYDVTGALISDIKITSTSLAFTSKTPTLYGSPIIFDHYNLLKDHLIGFSPDAALYFQIRGLETGTYEINLDGRTYWKHTNTELENGFYHAIPRNNTQFQNLIKLIKQKDFLFFNRYRPQNETYLFLFRKHEQGNNAVEIPQFDPLIEELDQKIAALKKPQPQKYELKKVE
jgi:hypothetical protein